MKKGQASIFIIIGVILLVIVASLILLRASTTRDSFETGTDAVKLNQNYLDIYIESCIEESVLDAEELFGLDKGASAGSIAAYVDYNLPRCVDEFKAFSDQDYEVEFDAPDTNVEITNDVLVVDTEFSVELSRGNSKLSHSSTRYTLQRAVTEKINSNRETSIIAQGGDFRLDLEAGTKAYLDGQEIDEIGIKQLDRNFNGLSNSVLAGMMAFYAFPHGATFSKPVKITQYYKESDIPIYIKEENLKIGYYHSEVGIWISLPTEVDAANNKLTAYTDHFSVYGTVINCGGPSDPIKQIVTPTLIKQVCDVEGADGGCGEWYYSEDPDPYGELYLEKEKVEYDENFEDEGILREYWLDLAYEEENNHFTFCEQCDENLNIYDEEQYFGIIMCENLDIEKEEMFLAVEKGIKLTTDVEEEITKPDDCETDDCVLYNHENPTLALTWEDIKDKPESWAGNYLILDNDCDEKSCHGECVNVGTNLEGNDVDVCYADYLTYKYATTDRDSDGKIKYEQGKPKAGLIGRQKYIVEFEANGDSCIAGTGPAEDEENEDPAYELSEHMAKLFTDSVELDEEETEKGERIHQIVELFLGEGEDSETLNVLIEPLCYETDKCSIREAGVYTLENKNPAIYFILETENAGEQPDACIKSNAAISFLGNNVKGDYNMICNEEMEGILDFVDGGCSECVRVDDYSKVNELNLLTRDYKWEKRKEKK